jgi:OmpA-OmpF porin, OOP family
VKQYPRLVPNYPPASEVINTSFLASLAKSAVTLTPATVPHYTAAPLTQVYGRADYTINFVTGSAEFTPDAQETLRELYRSLISSGLNIEIRGHTDNVGNPDANLILSKKRADAVKRWLNAQSATDFPSERIQTQAFGQDRPIADNTTAAGRARNRRVEIVVGSTGAAR